MRNFIEGVFVVFQLTILPANTLPGQIAVGFQLVQRRPDGGNPISGDGSQPGDREIPLRRKAEDNGKQTDGFQGQPGIPEVSGTHHREIPVFWSSYYWHFSSPFGVGMSCFTTPPPLFHAKISSEKMISSACAFRQFLCCTQPSWSVALSGPGSCASNPSMICSSRRSVAS